MLSDRWDAWRHVIEIALVGAITPVAMIVTQVVTTNMQIKQAERLAEIQAKQQQPPAAVQKQ